MEGGCPAGLSRSPWVMATPHLGYEFSWAQGWTPMTWGGGWGMGDGEWGWGAQKGSAPSPVHVPTAGRSSWLAIDLLRSYLHLVSSVIF